MGGVADRRQAQVFDSARAAAIRAEFPILARGEQSLAYLDNASTSQRPECVLNSMEDFYRETNANVHRGIYGLAVGATERYEAARDSMARFLAAPSKDELIFVRGVTEAVNLVAQSFVRPQVSAGDEILTTVLEHHSNFVPWLMVAEQTGAELQVVDVTENGDLDLQDFSRKLTPRTKFVSVTAISNAIGTVTPLGEIISLAHEAGVPVLVDGAQSAAHGSIDLGALGADFYAVSGHKMYGPTGIGVLWGKADRLREMPPYQGGGDMIREVRIDGVDYAAPPQRFEAGTPNIAGAIGLGAAAEFLMRLGPGAVAQYESAILDSLVTGLSDKAGVRIIGHPTRRAAAVSFVVEGVNSQDVATILDHDRVCVRVGHHCAQPLLRRLGETATIRASVAAFNDSSDVGRLLDGLDRVQRIFGQASKE